MEGRETIFRQKTIDRISSPEQMTDYLRVTNPGIWVILVAVILLLAGVFAWSMVPSWIWEAEPHSSKSTFSVRKNAHMIARLLSSRSAAEFASDGRKE